MMPALLDTSIAQAAADLRDREQPFAFATIVRTAGATAAKPGTKALLDAEGEILSGWLGGGCTRAAVRKATKDALADGSAKLISVAPEEDLAAQGVDAGTERDGVRFARNGCPSKGTVDIFIEPCLPAPELVVAGTSPVAEAVVRLAQSFHWDVVSSEPEADLSPTNKHRFIVIATQGKGDLAALRTALSADADYVAFVGSARKFASLSKKLIEQGEEGDALSQVRAPAGLDIGAVTPDEIALSILAQLTQARRSTVKDV
ncbi:MAG: XdhC family protein [Pseudomonadota bacterium]